jgi:sulfite reductase (ferredoxin)
MHDMGALALKVANGKTRLQAVCRRRTRPGAVPGKGIFRFVPEEELLPIAQAISRVFARLGEKQNRARARIKFLVANLGIDEFKRW